MENPEKQESKPEESFKTMTAFLLSTGLFVGKIPVAPGTLGTLVGIIPILIYWTKGGQYQLINQISITMAVFLVGIWASTVIVETYKEKDPEYIVIDEIAGYMVAMIGFEPTWQNLLMAFVIFRFFDILKPPPIRYFEKLPSGFGVMADDIVAGIYTWIVMFILVKLLGV
ncbi:phosphatidylglycerophosphatase A family protein [Persephonella sp.]